MDIFFLSSCAIYLAVLFTTGMFFYFKQKTSTDFSVGNRSLNYWITAVATHATDMSTWLFMAFPGLVYREGVFACWIAIGLVGGMFLTWNIIAPKLRMVTESINNPTLPSFFESGTLATFIRIFWKVLGSS